MTTLILLYYNKKKENPDKHKTISSYSKDASAPLGLLISSLEHCVPQNKRCSYMTMVL